MLISSKSSPPALGSSVQTSPPDQLPVVLESCVVNDPLSPPGPPRIPDSHCEACSENSMDTSKLKETGLKSSGNPAILCRAKSGDVSQLGSECAPDSDPLDIVLCSRDQNGVDLGLDLHLNVDSPMRHRKSRIRGMGSAPGWYPCTASALLCCSLCIQ
ncbi:hypothetical protein Nepgr_002582 [Nepenthes gracilis]|uniref:Uncharacterized protein n=1 Tax=Nepenthes gracilis TaxID=150966 RepID=A0AAD3P8Z6_NEPGR|nr:hypothetical protein Nepgr_002582 [Nepenthes gracilis]